MSPSEPMPFRVGTFDGEDSTRITVFDGHDRIRAEGRGRVETALPKGLYQVRLERLGAMSEHLVIHDAPTDEDYPRPERDSAMPASDTLYTHEYYQDPGMAFSTRSTVSEEEEEDGPDKVRLMIMLRVSGWSGDATGTDLARGLTLYEAGGARITDFGPGDCAADPQAGWLIHSALLRVGNYLLVRETGGGAARYLPLSLQKGWDSFVFIPHDRELRLGRASLDMVRKGEGFDPADPLTQQIDGALQGLGENLDLMSDKNRMMAIYGKFTHPLHGLIGAHAHFLGEHRQERLEGNMLSNLWHLMPGSTDVVALLLRHLERAEALPEDPDALAEQAVPYFGDGLAPFLPLSFPPMLRPGLRAVLRAAGRMPGLIAPGSWLDAVSLSPFDSGGPWTLWEQDLPDAPEVARTRRRTRSRQGAPSDQVLPSTQALYAAIKRAISDETGQPAGQMRAVTRMRELTPDTGAALTPMLRNVERDLGMRLAHQVTVGPDDRLRDLVMQMRDAAAPGPAAASRIAPQTELPKWVMQYAEEAVRRADDRESALGGGGPTDIRDMARQAGVPLDHMRQALRRVTEGS